MSDKRMGRGQVTLESKRVKPGHLILSETADLYHGWVLGEGKRLQGF